MATLSQSLTLVPGTRAVGPFALPAGTTRVKIALDRTTAGGLNAGDSGGNEVMTLTTQISVDGGATWQTGPGFGCAMGTFINPATSLPYTESAIAFALPTPCQVRGVVTVTQGFNTTVTVTTS